MSLIALMMAASTGCARRFKLTPDELARLDRRARNPEDLFVYTHKPFIAKYELNSEDQVQVDRTIDESRSIERPLVLVPRDRAGQIIERAESNGVPLLWISFSKKCNEKSCSYGFVRTEDNLYKLAFVPEREGYKLLAVYRKTERARNKMKKAKVAALGEANNVYLIKRKRRVKTVYLDVKKRIREDEIRTIEEEGGR